MGQAKLKQRGAFSANQISDWEAEQCVNFAVALARHTGWLLHVDWWTPSTDPDEDVPIAQFKVLRVYVADSGDGIFDVRGVRKILDFNQKTILPLAKPHGRGSIRTRYYSEEQLRALPLQSQPDAAKIDAARAAIEANPIYLSAIPGRLISDLPAHLAAEFALGRCAPFAEALSEATGLEPTALLALRYVPHVRSAQGERGGYFHSVVLHRDGSAEDSWGKASLQEIASRFGVDEFVLSHAEHVQTVKRLRTNSPEKFDAAFQKARGIIKASQK